MRSTCRGMSDRHCLPRFLRVKFKRALARVSHNTALRKCRVRPLSQKWTWHVECCKDVGRQFYPVDEFGGQRRWEDDCAEGRVAMSS
jgi:hypothetical protein